MEKRAYDDAYADVTVMYRPTTFDVEVDNNLMHLHSLSLSIFFILSDILQSTIRCKVKTRIIGRFVCLWRGATRRPIKSGLGVSCFRTIWSYL